MTPNDRLRQLPEGGLLIKEVTRTDAGEYSCYVENSFGRDTVTHRLVVHGKVEVANRAGFPKSPTIFPQARTSKSRGSFT